MILDPVTGAPEYLKFWVRALHEWLRTNPIRKAMVRANTLNGMDQAMTVILNIPVESMDDPKSRRSFEALVRTTMAQAVSSRLVRRVIASHMGTRPGLTPKAVLKDLLEIKREVEKDSDPT